MFGDLFLLMIFFFFFDAIDVVRDGRIKIFGENNTQALLQSDDAVPSKFLLVIFRIGVGLMKFEFFLGLWNEFSYAVSKLSVKGEF